MRPCYAFCIDSSAAALRSPCAKWRSRIDFSQNRAVVVRIERSEIWTGAQAFWSFPDFAVAQSGLRSLLHFAEAFSGWRDSSPHRANMLLAGATRMGIAAVYTPASKYKVYWSLIVAEPDDDKKG